MCPKDADGMIKWIDLDQTAPELIGVETGRGGGGGRGQTPQLVWNTCAPPPPNKPRLTKVWPSPTPNIENLPTPMDLAVQKL